MRTPVIDLTPGTAIIVPVVYDLVQPYAGVIVTLLAKRNPRVANRSSYDVWDGDYDGTPARVYLNRAGSVTVVSDPSSKVKP